MSSGNGWLGHLKQSGRNHSSARRSSYSAELPGLKRVLLSFDRIPSVPWIDMRVVHSNSTLVLSQDYLLHWIHSLSTWWGTCKRALWPRRASAESPTWSSLFSSSHPTFSHQPRLSSTLSLLVNKHLRTHRSPMQPCELLSCQVSAWYQLSEYWHLSCWRRYPTNVFQLQFELLIRHYPECWPRFVNLPT